MVRDCRIITKKQPNPSLASGLSRLCHDLVSDIKEVAKAMKLPLH